MGRMVLGIVIVTNTNDAGKMFLMKNPIEELVHNSFNSWDLGIQDKRANFTVKKFFTALKQCTVAADRCNFLLPSLASNSTLTLKSELAHLPQPQLVACH